MARGTNGNNFWILFLLIITGAVIGSFIGELLGGYMPILKFGYNNFGISTHTWDLKVIKLTLGLVFNINMFSILGIILAIIIYRKM